MNNQIHDILEEIREAIPSSITDYTMRYDNSGIQHIIKISVILETVPKDIQEIYSSSNYDDTYLWKALACFWHDERVELVNKYNPMLLSCPICRNSRIKVPRYLNRYDGKCDACGGAVVFMRIIEENEE